MEDNLKENENERWPPKKKEDDLKWNKMEDDLKQKWKNGRRPRTKIEKMEDDLQKMEDDLKK